MATYKYKLETLLTFRRNLEEQAHLELVREQTTLESLIRRLGELRADRERIIAEMEERKKKKIRAVLLSFFMDFIRNRDREIQVQATMVESQRQVVKQARGKLLEKVKDRKIIEKARERDHTNFLNEAMKEEMKEHDEMVVLAFGRGGRSL